MVQTKWLKQQILVDFSDDDFSKINAPQQTQLLIYSQKNTETNQMVEKNEWFNDEFILYSPTIQTDW